LHIGRQCGGYRDKPYENKTHTIPPGVARGTETGRLPARGRRVPVCQDDAGLQVLDRSIAPRRGGKTACCTAEFWQLPRRDLRQQWVLTRKAQVEHILLFRKKADAAGPCRGPPVRARLARVGDIRLPRQ